MKPGTMGFGWVWVPATWVQVTSRALAGFESQLHGFKSQTGFWLVLSPGTWVQVPICDKWFQQEGHNHNKIKSLNCWVGDPQTGNNKTKEVLPLLWRFVTPYQVSQPGKRNWEPDKGTRNPWGIWPSRPEFDYKISTGGTDSSLGGHKQRLVYTKTQMIGEVDCTGNWTKTTC